MIDKDCIFNQDCITGMKDIPDGGVDLIVTDPPYLINYASSRRKNHRFCRPIMNDDNEVVISDYLKECFRILKDNSAAYVFCSAKTLDVFIPKCKEVGFTLKNVLIWRKNNHTAGDLDAQYGQSYEPILFLNKGRRRINGKRIDDVWNFDRVAVGRLLHQNEKPVPLLMQCILKSSEPGDLVFDGFMGSASTAVACIRTKRHFVGYELDRSYYDIAVKRLRNERLCIDNLWGYDEIGGF